jgi:hypothetical protein
MVMINPVQDYALFSLKGLNDSRRGTAFIVEIVEKTKNKGVAMSKIFEWLGEQLGL